MTCLITATRILLELEIGNQNFIININTDKPHMLTAMNNIVQHPLNNAVTSI